VNVGSQQAGIVQELIPAGEDRVWGADRIKRTMRLDSLGGRKVPAELNRYVDGIVGTVWPVLERLVDEAVIPESLGRRDGVFPGPLSLHAPWTHATNLAPLSGEHALGHVAVHGQHCLEGLSLIVRQSLSGSLNSVSIRQDLCQLQSNLALAAARQLDFPEVGDDA
jgi:hypothetical protein